MTRPAPSRFGPYTLVYPLGSGGMGQVYLARQAGEHGIERLVALKRMLVHLSGRDRLVKLFLDEVRIAAQLNHGNIVQVIDHGVIDGKYFMAMEYVHGENLAEVLARVAERREYMPLDLVLQIGTSLCEALDYAHRKQGHDGRAHGIVHRDVSPHNVLLSFQGEVKLADFGVARAAEQTHQTLGGELRGKIAYMSPEQAYGRPLDGRSDLFSLGVVLYEALTNHSPFQRENSLATLEAVRAAQPPSLAMVRTDLPPELVELVHRALSLEVDRRPDSARTLYEALQQTSRLHNLGASPFDLADYLRDLFPEARKLEEPAGGAARTEVGQRADEVAEQVRRTLHYLRTRHAARSGELPALETDTVADEPAAGDARGAPHAERRRKAAGDPALATSVGASRARARLRWAVGGVAVLVAAGGALAMVLPRLRGGYDRARTGGRDAAPATSTRASADASAVPASRTATAPDAGARTATGTLVVRSSPAAAVVTVGGRRHPALTPTTIELAPGRHACTLALRGFRPWRGSATVREGERSLIDARLEALPAAISVSSSHRCHVVVDGRPLGETPIRERAIAPGTLSVGCRDAAAGIDERRRVRAPPGETLQVTFAFGVLAINLEPWAEVSVDGVRRGTTPLRLLLSVGEHRLLLRNPERGGLERRLSVTISAALPTRVSSW